MIGKFSGIQVLVLGFSIAVGLMIFLAISNAGLGFAPSVLIAMAIPMTTAIALLTLVRGKPKGFFSDWLEWLRLKAKKSPLFDHQTKTSKLAVVKDGFISHQLLVLEGRGNKATVSCGLEIASPAMENASIEELNHLEESLCGIVRQLAPGWTMQVSLQKGGGYIDDLLGYREETEAHVKKPWSRRQRNERFVRCSREEEAGLISSSQGRIFIKMPVTLNQLGLRSEEDWQNFLRTSRRQLEAFIAEIERTMTQINGHARVLSDEELFQEVHHYFNPQANKQAEWNQEKPLFENIIPGEGTPVTAPETGMYLGGTYHTSLALAQLPESTASGIMTHLSTLPGDHFRITTHLETLDPLAEIERAEGLKAKLERARQSGKQSRLDHDIRVLHERIDRLSSGTVSPVRVQVLIHLWASSAEELTEKMKPFLSAVSGMKAARLYEASLPTTCRNLFLAAVPGSPYREPAFWHLVDDSVAANLVPLGGDTKAPLRNAEAIYHTRQGGLIGTSGFHRNGAQKSPIQTFISGKTGSGKSVHGIDYLTQLDPYADWTVVIDHGGSFETAMQLLSDGQCRSFAPDLNGSDTLNYLDTLGVPLTIHHINRIVRILHLMVGHKSDEDQDSYRRSILNRCVRGFYNDWIDEWFNKSPTRSGKLIQQLTQLRLFREEENIKGDMADLLSAFQAAHHEGDQYPEDQEPPLSETNLITEGSDSLDLISLAASQLSREEAPTHRDLHEWMLSKADEEGRDQDEIAMLATLLEPWRADYGMMGCLFDGVNTIDLSADHVHIELGFIESADETVKSLVSHIITSQIIGETVRRPLSQRKHILIEELGAFINLQGGKKIIHDLYERARKLNTLVITVIQQISRLPEDLARTVVGNSGQAFFFRQREPGDVALLQKLFELPDSITRQLRKFSAPDAAHGASFICWEHLDDRVRITPSVNHASREMLYTADSRGAATEARHKILASYPDPMTGVLSEVSKQLESEGKS